jgi:hypothetical protein
MADLFNIYCDESCHLEHDGQRSMVLGALWCPAKVARDCNVAIRAIKEKHGLARSFEAKWTKVSPGKLTFYEDLIEYFFQTEDLHFRALIVPDKGKLRHEDYGQTHDDWYYKMYFDLLKVVLQPHSSYRVFLDIKDSRSAQKVAHLHRVLTNNMYDFERKIVQTLQTVRSHEVELLQLCDLLLGAVSYANRNLVGSPAKQALVAQIRQRSGYKLTMTTLLREDKVNIFRWDPVEAEA